MKKHLSFVVLAVVLISLFAGCAGKEEPIKAVFGDAGWDSIRFHNAVAAYIGEAAYNIEAEEI